MNLICKAVSLTLFAGFFSFAAANPPAIYFEVLELGKRGNVDGLQALFEWVEKGREASGDSEQHLDAFGAFHTTHPDVEATVLAWIEAHPNSAHGYAARAGRLMHEALIVRGEHTIRETPSASLDRMRALMSEAREVAETALEHDPTHHFAASKLAEVGRWGGERDLRDRAVRIASRYRKPEDSFWSELYRFQPQWGGWPGATDAYCERGAEEFDSVDVAECKLIAAIDRRPREIDAREALERLQAEYPGRWRGTVIGLMMDSWRYEEAAELLLENYFQDVGYVERIARATEDSDIIGRLISRRLADTPRHPRLLRLMSMNRQGVGDHDGAIDLIERALELGSTIPEVRAQHIAVNWHAGKSDEEIMAMAESALRDTEFHPKVYHMVDSYSRSGIPVRVTSEPRDDLPELAPLPENACWRKSILELEPWMCATYPDAGFCNPGTSSMRQRTLERLTTEAECG
ncbi:MAG: hypothetical protein AAF415_04205 [Pseudomonadota bacterium]